VSPRAGLDDLEKRKYLTLPGLELRPLGRPACSQSLYRLRNPGSYISCVVLLLLLLLLLTQRLAGHVARIGEVRNVL
jgi:hypothetical protein